jgi:hypothetical protein
MPSRPRIALTGALAKPCADKSALRSFLSAASCIARYAAVTTGSVGLGAD